MAHILAVNGVAQSAWFEGKLETDGKDKAGRPGPVSVETKRAKHRKLTR